jgi:hypothetical protein
LANCTMISRPSTTLPANRARFKLIIIQTQNALNRQIYTEARNKNPHESPFLQS